MASKMCCLSLSACHQAGYILFLLLCFFFVITIIAVCCVAMLHCVYLQVSMICKIPKMSLHDATCVCSTVAKCTSSDITLRSAGCSKVWRATCNSRQLPWSLASCTAAVWASDCSSSCSSGVYGGCAPGFSCCSGQPLLECHVRHENAQSPGRVHENTLLR